MGLNEGKSRKTGLGEYEIGNGDYDSRDPGDSYDESCLVLAPVAVRVWLSHCTHSVVTHEGDGRHAGMIRTHVQSVEQPVNTNIQINYERQNG